MKYRLLVEGVRQGRDHHLGGPADRLPVDGRRPPRVRAARLPPGGGVQLVHVLADPGPLPLRARCPARDVPRGQARHGRRPGRRLGLHRPGPREGAALQVRAGQGRSGPGDVGRGRRDRRRRARLHRQAVGPGPDRRLLPDPRDVAGVLRLRRPLPRARRRADALLLRLVRGPAQRLAPDVRRPDRRAGVGGLVGRRLPRHVGLQRPHDPHPGRALDDRGALPRPEGRRSRARLRRERQVRRRVGAGAAGHRRGARARDRARRPQGVLRRPAGAVLHRLQPAVHRPAVPRGARRGPGCRQRRHRLPARQVRRRRRPRPPREHLRERDVEAGAPRRAHRRGRRAERLGRVPLRRGGVGSLEPRPRRCRAGPDPPRTRRRVGAGAAAPLRHPRRQGGAPGARGPGAARRRPAGHDRARPPPRPVRRAPRGSPGHVAHRLRRPVDTGHPGVAGGDHQRPRRAGGASRPRVGAERHRHAGPRDDPPRGRHQPLVPLRPDLPGDPRPHLDHRLPGTQRRGLGALRRAGEDPPDHGLPAPGLRPRLAPTPPGT